MPSSEIRRNSAQSTPVCLAEPVEVPDTVGAVQGLCLVRAKHNPVLGKDRPRLFETVRNRPVSGYLEIEIDRVTARPKSSRKKAVSGRTA